jgi:hypothetical protein
MEAHRSEEIEEFGAVYTLLLALADARRAFC